MGANLCPPFNEESAKARVKSAEDAWNTRDPEIIVKAYTRDCEWRNRTEFLRGTQEIIEFLKRK